ncbi:MAG: hypothetical protein MO853_06660 [Candidatus Protistobacter heckmanni]|nr:hypothetical protein [Candidatus Protistobacter heckmanni]
MYLLAQRDPSLLTQERHLRERIGLGGGTQFFLVEGESAERVLQRLEALSARLEPLRVQGELSGWQSVDQFVPSQRLQ